MSNVKKTAGEAKITEENEHIERTTYREKCKHRDEYGTCLFYTGWFGSFHMTCGCVPSAKCRRMKRYDKLNPQKITQ